MIEALCICNLKSAMGTTATCPVHEVRFPHNPPAFHTENERANRKGEMKSAWEMDLRTVELQAEADKLRAENERLKSEMAAAQAEGERWKALVSKPLLKDRATERDRALKAEAEIERLHQKFQNYADAASAVLRERKAENERLKEALEKIANRNRTRGYPTGAEWGEIMDWVNNALGETK